MAIAPILVMAAMMSAANGGSTQGMETGRLLSSSGVGVTVADPANGSLIVGVDGWDGFVLDRLGPKLRVDGKDGVLGGFECKAEVGTLMLTYRFTDIGVLTLHISPDAGDGLRIESSLENTSGHDILLNDVELLATNPAGRGAVFGADSLAVRVFEQGNYWGRVVPLEANDEVEKKPGVGEPAGERPRTSHASEFVSVAYDRTSKKAFLAGFESSERWVGRIMIEPVGNEAAFSWRLAFDGGDLAIRPNETVRFENVAFLAGGNAWRLLETYADLVAKLHPVQSPKTPPVSWCSWYPYRLGVTEDRVLETARIASERLKPLGLSVLELDLGWQTGQLPSTYGENEQFSHGLGWLSERLREYGFDLGVWCAPFSISEFDPVAKEHPEWLIQGEDGQPVVHSEWFWKPHGKVYILDLSHPGAQQYLREKMSSLYARGVRYLKSDFIGCASDGRAKRRHDMRVVTGAGTEAARIGAKIIRDALPDALLLNCGGPEMPGTGHWPLLYSCSDTGNTGFISTSFQQTNYQALACHLFKNRRWGVLQPSCLCVGLPGTLEDARLRATIAFLTGGQIDISDTLVSLPEDRWRILTATLPVLDVTAEPVDLFEPILGPSEYGYSSTCADGAKEPLKSKEYPPGSVWHAHVKTDWDEWDLVGIFCYENTASEENPTISRFQIPFDRLGLAAGQRYWAFEFWSGQFLGAVPGKRGNPGGYEHPGDVQDLSVGDVADVLDIAFFGPGAKLLCLRSNRPCPWVVGTGFHQSCGAELRHVAWDAARSVLAGELHRPVGEEGGLFFTDGGKKIAACEVDGQPVSPRPSANGAWCASVLVKTAPVRWQVRFE